MATVELRNVFKAYGEVQAVRDLSLTCRDGEFGGGGQLRRPSDEPGSGGREAHRRAERERAQGDRAGDAARGHVEVAPRRPQRT